MADHMGHAHGPTSGRKLWLSLGVTLTFVVGEAVAGPAFSLARASLRCRSQPLYRVGHRVGGGQHPDGKHAQKCRCGSSCDDSQKCPSRARCLRFAHLDSRRWPQLLVLSRRATRSFFFARVRDSGGRAEPKAARRTRHRPRHTSSRSRGPLKRRSRVVLLARNSWARRGRRTFPGRTRSLKNVACRDEEPVVAHRNHETGNAKNALGLGSLSRCVSQAI